MVQDNTRKTLKIFWQHSLNYKFSVTVIFISVFGASVVGVIVPLFYKRFFDVLVSGQEQGLIVNKLILILLVVAGLQLISWGFWRLATFNSNYFQSKVMVDLANYCFVYLHRHSFSFFNNNFVGSLVKKIKWFSRAFEIIVDRITWNLFPLVINVLIIIFVLLSRNWLLSLAVFIC